MSSGDLLPEKSGRIPILQRSETHSENDLENYLRALKSFVNKTKTVQRRNQDKLSTVQRKELLKLEETLLEIQDVLEKQQVNHLYDDFFPFPGEIVDAFAVPEEPYLDENWKPPPPEGPPPDKLKRTSSHPLEKRSSRRSRRSSEERRDKSNSMPKELLMSPSQRRRKNKETERLKLARVLEVAFNVIDDHPRGKGKTSRSVPEIPCELLEEFMRVKKLEEQKNKVLDKINSMWN